MSGAAARVADATGNWVDTRAPMWSRPYLRLARFDRPIGSWLLLMPCWWSAALATAVSGDIGQLPGLVLLFFVGAFVMRGAGCTWNDITDRDLDALVERTRSRPIPAGQVSVAQATIFLVAQALIGLAVLLQFNRFAVATGIASLLIVAIYPFMKRITWWPQIVLGLAFSWGALMGFAVVLGRIDASALLLYVGSIAWVIGYDTIYAHQDAEDDALIGIKSTALLFGARTRLALMVFYAMAVALIGGRAMACRGALAGRNRACRVRRASGLADCPAGYFGSGALPARFQIQPRCRPAAVCRDCWPMRCCGPVRQSSSEVCAKQCALRDRGRNGWQWISVNPGDDLAFAVVKVRRIEQIAAAPPHQEFRTPRPDRVVTPAPLRRFGHLVFRQLRQPEDVAPHLPGRRDLVAIRTHA